MDYYNTHAHTDTDQVNSQRLNGLVFNIYNPDYSLPSATPLSFIRNQPAPVGGQRNSELGVYAEDTITYGPVSAVGGIRYARDVTYSAAFGGVNFNETNNVALPHGALIFHPVDWVSLYGSYSESFVPNLYSPQPGAKLTSPVSPTTSQGEEVGAKAQLADGRLLATAALFHIDLQHVLTVTEAGSLGFTAAERSEGAELGLAGSVTRNIDVSLGYTFLNAYYSSDTDKDGLRGKRLYNAPRHHVGAFGSYHFTEGRVEGLTLGGGFTAQSRNAVDSENTGFLPGFAVFNAFAAYDWFMQSGRLVRFQLNCNNIFNTTYYPEATSKSVWIPYGTPQQFLASVKVVFD